MVSSDQAESYLRRGLAHYEKGKYDQAIVDYTEALRLAPDFAAAYIFRGDVHREKGEYDRAIEDYDNAVRLCPDYETDFIDRDFAYGGQDTVERAIKLLESKIGDSDNPKSAADYYYSGVRFLFWNDRLHARRCFELAEKGGYDDGANGAKLAKHLDNLTN